MCNILWLAKAFYKVKDFLLSIAKMDCSVHNPGGCFFTSSIAESSNKGMPEEALNHIVQLNENVKKMLIDFFIEEKLKGNLPANSQPDRLVLFLLTITNGMALLAKNGASLEDLEKIIDQAVTTLN